MSLLPLAIIAGISWPVPAVSRAGRATDLREILRNHAHAALDLGDAFLRDVERIAIAQRLVDRAVADGEHDGRDEHRDHHLDECEAARAHQCLSGAAVLGRRGSHPDCRPGCRCCSDCPADCLRTALRHRVAQRPSATLPTTPVTVVVQRSSLSRTPLDVLGDSGLRRRLVDGAACHRRVRRWRAHARRCGTCP